MLTPSIPQAAIDIICEFEGFLAKPYRCPAGVPTLGFGTTRYPNGTAVRLTDAPCTQDTARSYLAHDLAVFAKAIDQSVKVPLSDNERSALLSFVYNVGVGAFQSSTLLRLLNAGNHKGAQAQFARWNKAGGKVLAGLTRRRAAEAALFVKP